MTMEWRSFFFSFCCFALCSGSGNAQVSASGKYRVYVGTYTDHQSQGIYGYGFDSSTGRLTPLGLAAKSDDPSFLTVAPSHRFLYAVNEVDHYQGQSTGSVSAFARRSGNRKAVFVKSGFGARPGPAYVSLDRTGKFVLIANYPLGQRGGISGACRWKARRRFGFRPAQRLKLGQGPAGRAARSRHRTIA